MQNKLKTADYIDLIKKEVLTIKPPKKFDLNYYIQTFMNF